MDESRAQHRLTPSMLQSFHWRGAAAPRTAATAAAAAAAASPTASVDTATPKQAATGRKRSRAQALAESTPTGGSAESPRAGADCESAGARVLASATPSAGSGRRIPDVPAPFFRDGVLPFVSNFDYKGVRGHWRERFASVCADCFAANVPCLHFPELPLRCLLIGHNPSTHAFASGYFYSHKSNRMWQLCTGTFRDGSVGLCPRAWPIERQNDMPLLLGVGLTDLGTTPGSDASAYSKQTLLSWRQDLYRALEGHIVRVTRTASRLLPAREVDADTGGGGGEHGAPLLLPLRAPLCECLSAPGAHAASLAAYAADWLCEMELGTPTARRAPAIVAFTGKAQWKFLFDPPLSSCETGFQPAHVRPPGWPLPSSTRVFVLPSSSGRSALTVEQRASPYELLAQEVRALRWPAALLGAV